MSRAPHRFYYGGQLRRDEARVVELSPEESHHLLRVLRLGVGAGVDLFDASGNAFAGVVEPPAGELARVRLIGPIEREGVLGPPLNIAVTMIKRRGMDLLIEKLSEVGVDSIQPLLSDRGVVEPDTGPEGSPPERWVRLAIAAAKQCGRARPLAILPPEPVLDWLERGRPPAHTAYADLNPKARPIAQWLAERSGAPLPMWIAIGPEGGWTERERIAFEHAGFLPVRLLGLVLRAETAALAAAAACRMLPGPE